MRVIDRIVADIGDLSKAKTIRPVDIRYLGYILTDKIRLRDTHYILYKVLDEDTKRSATFCFLLFRSPDSGIVIPFVFDRYYQQAVDERRVVSKKTVNKKKTHRKTL